jgi:hypothetical protein
MTASCCCQSKQHAVRALFAAVTLHVLCILLGIATCVAPFVSITALRPTTPISCGYATCTYNYVSETVPVNAAALSLSFAVPALALLALGMVLSILASVFICLRACRLQRNLQGGSSENKGCHTRAYTTLVLSILSTLSYVTGCSIIWGAAIALAKLAEEKSRATVAVGPGYSCASLTITVSIATSILEGVSHCCCKVKASPATSVQAASTMPTALASLDKLAAPPGYLLAFVPASSAMQALPLPLPTHTPPFPTTATAASNPAAALAASNPPPAAEKLV